MNSEHDVTLDIADMPQEIAALNIVIDSKKIKEVDLPEDENIKDIGSMSAAELEEYIDGDASEQFENWLFQIMGRSEEHTSELQSRGHLVCRLLLEKKKK